MTRHRTIGFGLVCGLLSTLALAEQPMPSVEEMRERGVTNWAAPLYWSPSAPKADPAPTVRSKNGFSPLPLIAVTPCRAVDTRVASMPPGYGPPSMGANETRTFQLAGQCGIGTTAQAVSLNITVTGGQGFGYIALYPLGGSVPVVSTLNFAAGQTVANAAIVALGENGFLAVLSAGAGTDLIIDTNGYYAPAPVGSYNTFLGNAAGNDSMTGDYNTAAGFGSLAVNAAGINNTGTGAYSLAANTDGSGNTADGSFALWVNLTGNNNTAVGVSALLSNTTGSSNTAAGFHALYTNVDGASNTAAGQEALYLNSGGSSNTAIGIQAMYSNVAGTGNSAVGEQALYGNATGINNTAVGYLALGQSTGNGNTAIGTQAGFDLTSGDENLYIGNEGVDGESNTMRLGSGSIHTRAFMSGVRGVTTGQNNAVPVMIDGLGQLGTVSSSARFKDDVADMADSSSGLLSLRPVTFRYKQHPDGAKQFGLIAEEVENVLPELVVHDASGRAETVLYHELPAMLLNEIQKQQKLIECQIREIENLTARVAALEEGSPGRP